MAPDKRGSDCGGGVESETVALGGPVDEDVGTAIVVVVVGERPCMKARAATAPALAVITDAAAL